MAGETLSTNMNMPIPGVGNTSGPTWASDLNSSLTIVDQHDHTAGSGVQLSPNSILINSDLPFNANSATSLLKAAFTSQSAAITGTNFISVIGGNMYFNDGSGNQIPMTSAGGVAGSPGSIGSLTSPASATYTAGSKLFTWLADSSKSAAMDNGSVTIRETNVASAKGVTIASAASLAADYSLTLPSALPGSTQVVNSTSGGSLGFISYDSIGSSMSSTGANAIAASRTRAVGSTVGLGGIALSGSCGTFAVSSTTFTDVTNLSITITTSGRPVMLMLVANAASPSTFASVQVNRVAASPTAFIQFIRTDTTNFATQQFSMPLNSTSGDTILIPPSSFQAIDTASGAGVNTFKVQARSAAANTLTINNCSLLVYEL